MNPFTYSQSQDGGTVEGSVAPIGPGPTPKAETLDSGPSKEGQALGSGLSAAGSSIMKGGGGGGFQAFHALFGGGQQSSAVTGLGAAPAARPMQPMPAPMAPPPMVQAPQIQQPFAMSDQRTKRDVYSAQRELRAFLAALGGRP